VSGVKCLVSWGKECVDGQEGEEVVTNREEKMEKEEWKGVRYRVIVQRTIKETRKAVRARIRGVYSAK